jgi:hypothetical protein
MTAAFESQINGQGGENGGYTGGGEGQQGNDGNPAWQPFLEAVPQEYHAKVTPLLQEWDKGVNDRFQKVHSEYEPWKPIIGAAGDPQTAHYALNLLDTMYNNPEVIYQALKDKYNFDAKSEEQQGNGNEQGQNGPTQEPWESRYNQLNQQQAQIAEYLLTQKRAEMEAQQDALLEQELGSLKQKYGEYDERYVLALMQGGASAEDAVKQFQQFQEETAKNYRPKPLIMGGGGQFPGGNFNPAKASDGQVNDLVVQYLQSAAAERNR